MDQHGLVVGDPALDQAEVERGREEAIHDGHLGLADGVAPRAVGLPVPNQRIQPAPGRVRALEGVRVEHQAQVGIQTQEHVAARQAREVHAGQRDGVPGPRLDVGRPVGQPAQLLDQLVLARHRLLDRGPVQRVPADEPSALPIA